MLPYAPSLSARLYAGMPTARPPPWEFKFPLPGSLTSTFLAGMSKAGAPQVAVPTLLIDDLLVRIHFIIVMIRWTGLAPWEFEFPFPMQACRRLGLPQWPFQHSGPRKRKAPSGILVDLSYPATYGVTSGPP